VNQTIRKKQPNSDYKSKKHCTEKQTKHILLAKQPNRDCMKKKTYVAKFVKYCGVFLCVWVKKTAK